MSWDNSLFFFHCRAGQCERGVSAVGEPGLLRMKAWIFQQVVTSETVQNKWPVTNYWWLLATLCRTCEKNMLELIENQKQSEMSRDGAKITFWLRSWNLGQILDREANHSVITDINTILFFLDLGILSHYLMNLAFMRRLFYIAAKYLLAA